jgi:hypothetical protein
MKQQSQRHVVFHNDPSWIYVFKYRTETWGGLERENDLNE